MIFDFESQILAHLDTSPLHQFAKFNDFIWHSWFYPKIFLILYPSFKNTTTSIAIILISKVSESDLGYWLDIIILT